MLPILYLVFLCSNFLFIKSEDDGNLTIEVNQVDNCNINRESYTFTEGQNVTVIVKPEIFVNHGWWSVNSSTGSPVLYDKLRASKDNYSQKDRNTAPFSYTRTVDKSMGGTWEFKFYILQNIKHKTLPMIHYSKDKENYTESVCKTNVTIEPKPKSDTKKDTDMKFIIIASVVFAVQAVIILAQAAYIVFLKAQARKLIEVNTHNNLSKKSESISNDTARYCSNPGQKMMKEPIPVGDDNRDSVIYEAPNIEIPSNGRMPMQPPQPPAINTMPRTPRSDHNMRVDPQGMLASALNSPARSPITDSLPPNFQRLKHNERENSVMNRPPLPLPPQGHSHNDMFQEVYEEMETEENTYEPPPIINTMPPRLPMPPKKVPTGNLLDVKDNTLRLRQANNKPPVTRKPQPLRAQTMTPANEFEQALRRRNNTEGTGLPRGPPPGHMMQPQHQEQSLRRRPTGDAQTTELEEALRRRNNVDAPTNELEEALRRRNNVKQVPIISIPDPSSRSSPKPRPGPPPVQKSRPPPVRHPVQEEIYYNEASSDDEEWTYEPLKPLNSYDQNIYNV